MKIITTSKELADSLYGWSAEDNFTRHVIKLAKDNGLVIVSAIGDDTIAFNGGITDEFEAFRGGNTFIAKETTPARIVDGKVVERECVEYIPYKKQSDNKDRKKIEIFWEEHRLFTWKFLTLIPHHTFDIKKNNKNFCKGIVFNVKDI